MKRRRVSPRVRRAFRDLAADLSTRVGRMEQVLDRIEGKERTEPADEWSEITARLGNLNAAAAKLGDQLSDLPSAVRKLPVSTTPSPRRKS